MTTQPVDCIISTYNTLIASIETWSRLGVEVLPAGTRRIGHIPHAAPQAYLHTVFPPLSADEIRTMEAVIGRALPPSLAFFFSKTNGIHLFDEVTLYGLRASYDRSNIPGMLEQPFDIGLPNQVAAANTALKDLIVVGSFIEDDIEICVDQSGRPIFWDKKAEKRLPTSFDNIVECLLSLFSSAALFFDDRGRKIAPPGARLFQPTAAN